MSIRSKKRDQQTVSKAEFKKYPNRGKIKALLGCLNKGFDIAYSALCGAKALTRLKNSAKGRKRSTLGYALDVLCK